MNRRVLRATVALAGPLLTSSALLMVVFVTATSAQDLTCGNYTSLPEGQKTVLAYGYLEGVQAALDKQPADILVPPSHSRHPMWWVLPAGLGEKPFNVLADKVAAHCRSTEKRDDRLLAAFLSVAHQKDGWPALGISTDRAKTDPWKKILGAGAVSCSAFVESPEETKRGLVYGYYLGTEALRIRLKVPRDIGLAWPSNASRRDVQLEVQNRCQKSKATVREILWLTTVEMAVQDRTSGAESQTPDKSR